MTLLFTFLSGFFTSMFGHAFVNSILPAESKRLRQLASYAIGDIGKWISVILVYEWLTGDKTIRKFLLSALVISSFIFGTAVMMGGLLRGMANSHEMHS